MRALGDAVIIKPLDENGESKIGNIIIPGNVSKNVGKGKVVSIGRGIISAGQIIPSEVQVGDEVLYAASAKIPVTIEGEEHFIIQEQSIHVILD
jgi:chaperonin GroES